MIKIMYQRLFCYGSDLVDYHVEMYTRLVLAKWMVLLNFM
jgi:hypothetical protein